MMRILVTGASGFVGRHALCPLVARGYEVHAVSSRRIHADASGVVWHCANLLEREATTSLLRSLRPTHLLHLAWHTDPSDYWNSPENYRWLDASATLVQQFQRYGGGRVVMAGTCAEYDWRYGFCSETATPCRPSSLYGTSKHSLYKTLQAVCEETRLSGAWARLFFLYGPGEHRMKLLPSVISALVDGQMATCRHGELVRDYLYVVDAADALATLVDSRVEGPVNIASGQGVALGELTSMAAECLGARNRVRLGLDESACDDAAAVVADVRRLQEEVGFSPRFDLATGIAATVAWRERHVESRSIPCIGGRL